MRKDVKEMSFFDKFRMDGKTVIITGGGTGIGKACAVGFAEAGANVVITGRREEKLREVSESIRKQGGECTYIVSDVSREEDCRKIVEETVSRYGSVDTLINNAGVRGENGDLEKEFSTENLKNTMSVDFEGVFYMIRYAYPCLAEKGGSVINISSLAALRGSGPVVYSAAKGAVRSMSRSLARKLGNQNIRVNTIYPGLIITEMNQGILDHPEMEAHFRQESPMGLLGEPEDIACCALYLASDAARFVTGQDFVVDGGAMA